MTYLESITYLTGNFLQVSQFAIKNAYRVITLTESKEKETPYMAGAISLAEAAEALAKAYLTMNNSLSGEELVQFFSLHKGLSSKDFKDLKLILNKRDYLVSYFYLENTSRLALEEVAIYESIIKELKEYVELASTLNVSLSKACDRLYSQF